MSCQKFQTDVAETLTLNPCPLVLQDQPGDPYPLLQICWILRDIDVILGSTGA